jgi:AbrB family transcriptional regulator, transcriptional pleiotropic regulator of transition state genes
VKRTIGIVRNVDELGRMVIPVELRRKFGISDGDVIEFFVDESMVCIKKYEPACIFCGSTEENVVFKRKIICKLCLKDAIGKAPAVVRAVNL